MVQLVRMMRIEFVNHISFIDRPGPFALLRNLSGVGSAFDDGWRLLWGASEISSGSALVVNGELAEAELRVASRS